MKIHYFASVRELLAVNDETVDQQFADVSELIDFLSLRGGLWQKLLNSEQTLVAVDQTMASRNTPLTISSEVAFFPFMTGG